MDGLILHAYDASPFTQKALKMLAIKGVRYGFVETPMIAPKPDLEVFTGGYRGTPVLQDGADIYVDNARIAAALDAHAADPRLTGDAVDDAAAVLWGEQFFEAGLHMAIDAFAQDWEPAFTEDRKAVFARLDFDSVRAQSDEARSLLRVHATRVDDQLADGRNFLRGKTVSLTDLHAWAVFWFARAAFPECEALLGDLVWLPEWETRVAALGEGDRHQSDADAAQTLARACEPTASLSIDTEDPLGLHGGQRVAVSPTFSDRGTSHGTLAGLDANQIVIAVSNDTVGTVHVHFPRQGYRVERAG